MRTTLAALAVLALSAVACTLPDVQGGSNGNDRSTGGDQGEELLTGAMVVSPDGKYALMQRNETSVLLDIQAHTAREMPEQAGRFLFAKSGSVGVAINQAGTELTAYDLTSLTSLWKARPAMAAGHVVALAKLSDDGKFLVLGDAGGVLVLDGATGERRGIAQVGSTPYELSFVPGTDRALVVGTTRWTDHKPLTDVIDVDLATLSVAHVDVPNCSAPVVVTPDAKRALLSPTFCEDVASNTKQTWTNPDPVSVIDLGAEGPVFRLNLPGFGPVAMDAEGSRAVAYLDMERIDPSMFPDASKIPDKSGPRYHIMQIDPASLAYTLTPVGDVLPRFAMTRDGSKLLVDATVTLVRGGVSVKASIGSDGVSVSANLFGGSESLFGVFDLDQRVYAPITGPKASLDRFVQMGDNAHVFGLTMTPDGLGGDLYRIDIDAHAVTAFGRSYRDIGLLPDGKSLLLRQRLPAGSTQAGGTISWFRRESYCVSLDGITCEWSLDFQDTKPFSTGTVCEGSHDC